MTYTRRTFLKLLALALPMLTILAKLPVVGKPFDTLNAKCTVTWRYTGKTFFVDRVKGRDWFPGTVGRPFKTIAHAMEAGKQTDLIYVLDRGTT